MALTDERDYSQLLPPLPSPLAIAAGTPAPPVTPLTAATSDPAAVAPPPAMPTYLRPIVGPSQQTQTDAAELQRLQNTGSGVSQFQQKHHVLGTLARIGDVVGSILAPGATAMIPGTTLHHSMLVNDAQGNVAQDIANDERQAQTGAIPVDAQARQIQAEANAWKASHPTPQMKSVPLSDANGKPVEGSFDEHTGKYFDPAGAPISNPVPFTKPTPAHIVQGEDGAFYAIDPHTQAATPILMNGKPLAGKPITSPGLPEILAQVGAIPRPSSFPGGKDDPNYIKALQQWGERYEHLKNQEAEAGAIARGAGYNQYRPLAIYDPATGTYHYEYATQAVASGAAPTGPAQKVLQQQAFFSDIQNASDNLRKVLSNPKLDAFSPSQIAKLKVAMSPEDPGLMNAEVQAFAAKNLTSEQQDLVTWLAQLQERALSLRSIAGMGQGSETTRAAILHALPSITSGNTSLALKQLDALDNMVKNLERGVGNVKGSPGISSENNARSSEVMIQAPDGRKLMIPKENLQQAIKLGAKEINQ